jgi:dipeptidyl-peptidase-4
MGGKQKAYALTNRFEFFAESTEAFFGKNDFFPYDKEDLKKYDPQTYLLMREKWRVK